MHACSGETPHSGNPLRIAEKMLPKNSVAAPASLGNGALENGLSRTSSAASSAREDPLGAERAANCSRKRAAADFQFFECIGEGSYSKVYRAMSKNNMHIYAIKVLSKQHIQKEKKRKYVTIEKNTLNVLGKHPGIVTLYYTFQDPQSLYFVIDYAQNGEFLMLIHKLGSLSLELTFYYTLQLIDTVIFIHDKGIIHRDLKPENILLSKDWKIMITDFGAAKFVDRNDPAGTAKEDLIVGDSNGSFVGTAEYVSPELLKYNHSSFSSDFWSLGCIIYQMIIGRPPFKASNEYATFEKIVDANYTFPDPKIYPIPSAVVNLIENLLLEDPQRRLGKENIKHHSWFKHVDWENKAKIWGKVPKFDSYKPEKYFKKTNAQQTPSTNTKPVLLTYQGTNGYTENSYADNKPSTLLKRQIIKAQGNNQLMNKIINNRIDEKDKSITKKLIESNDDHNDPLSSLKVVEKRISKSPKLPVQDTVPLTKTDSLSHVSTSTIVPHPKNLQQTVAMVKKPILKANRSSVDSAKSVVTVNSSRSVIIRKNPNTKSSQITSFSQSTGMKPTKKTLDSKQTDTKVLTSGLPPPVGLAVKEQPLQAKYQKKESQERRSRKKAPTNSSSITKPEQFIPRRVPSSDAAAAAGAVGTLLTHNRHLNLISSTSAQYKQLQMHQNQLINPVLLDKQIPYVITSKLMINESILKLDNIFKSELGHKPKQFVNPGETLNHTILERIIHKYDRDLVKDMKSCIMVVTTMARIFIYELNDNFQLRGPQSATQIQAQNFYQKVTEIKLTNRNVSLYDYEFDEEINEGYLILELSNVNKLVFLSAWDRSRLMKGGLNSNVRVGFRVNETESWVDSFLHAKSLLKRRENEPKGKLENNNVLKSSKSSSTMGVQGSFRKLKLNTQSRIRSFSNSSKENAFSASNISPPSSNTSDNGNPESHNNSLINGVNKLALGMKSSFKKDNERG